MDDEPFSPLSAGSGDGTSSADADLSSKPVEFSSLKGCRQSRVRFISESEDNSSTMTEV